MKLQSNCTNCLHEFDNYADIQKKPVEAHPASPQSEHSNSKVSIGEKREESEGEFKFQEQGDY